MNQTDIAGSPFTFQVDPGPLDITSTEIQLAARSAGRTGLSTSFLLSPKDIYGNPPFYDETLVVWAMVTVAGTYTPQNRRLLGTKLSHGNNFGRRWHKNAFINNDHESVQAMSDDYNEQVYTPTVTTRVVSNSDNTYTISFLVTMAGLYDVFVYMNGILLQLNSSSIATVASCVVGPGLLDYSYLMAVGPGVDDGTILTAGSSTLVFTIVFGDNFGNAVNVPNVPNVLNTYRSQISSNSSVSIYKTLAANTYSISPILVTGGTYTVQGSNIIYTCSPTTAGVMNIALIYTDLSNNISIASAMSPSHVNIVAAVSGLNNITTTVFGPGVIVALACSSPSVCPPNVMYVQVEDAYNNPIFPNLTMCTCFSLTGFNSSVLISNTGQPIYDNFCGISYSLLPGIGTSTTVSFNVTYTSGPTTFLVRVATSITTTVDSSRFRFSVPVLLGAATNPDPNQCLAFGDLGGLIIAGQSGYITVQLVDSSALAIQSSPMSGDYFVRLNFTPVNVKNSSGFIPPTTPTWHPQDNGDGTFTVQYDAYATGSFQLVIYVGSTNSALGGLTNGYLLQVRLIVFQIPIIKT
jgi:hypothetical protein